MEMIFISLPHNILEVVTEDTYIVIMMGGHMGNHIVIMNIQIHIVVIIMISLIMGDIIGLEVDIVPRTRFTGTRTAVTSTTTPTLTRMVFAQF